MTKGYAPWSESRARAIMEAGASAEGALLPILHALQAEFGWIGDEAAALAAEVLNLTRAEVHGVVTFYHDFRRAPPARHSLKLCRAEACQARGGRETEARIEAALGVRLGETTSDGAVSLEPVYCLGLCASGPAALFDGAPLARLEGERVERLARKIQSLDAPS
jgi:formate dehydrogenase subunit gamma